MKTLRLIAGIAGLICTPLQATEPVTAKPVSPEGVKQDVRCFMLFATAVSDAPDSAGAKKEAASLGLMYYYAKLGVEAPGLNIPEAVVATAKELLGNPKAREYGAACDSEFQQRAKNLITIGNQLQSLGKAQSQSSSSS